MELNLPHRIGITPQLRLSFRQPPFRIRHTNDIYGTAKPADHSGCMSGQGVYNDKFGLQICSHGTGWVWNSIQIIEMFKRLYTRPCSISWVQAELFADTLIWLEWKWTESVWMKEHKEESVWYESKHIPNIQTMTNMRIQFLLDLCKLIIELLLP